MLTRDRIRLIRQTLTELELMKIQDNPEEFERELITLETHVRNLRKESNL